MRAWQIVRKDLLILLRDRRALITLLILPVVFIAILGFTTGQLLTGRSANRLRLTFVDQNRSSLAQQVIQEISKDPRIEVELAESVTAAEDRIGQGVSTAAIVIGEGFSRKAAELQLIDLLEIPERRLAEGLASLDIQVRSKTTLPLTRAAISQLVFLKTLQVLARYVTNRLPLVKAYIDAHPQLAFEARPNSAAPEVNPYFSDLIASRSAVYLTLVPSYTVMFAFFLINFMARSFIGERTTGTLLRLKAAPVSNTALITGKIVPFFLVAVVQGIILFAAGRLLFGMSWGVKPWMLLPVIVSTSLAVTALGLLTGALARSEVQVVAYGTFLVVVLAGISGCLMPRDWMPPTMQKVSLVTPHAWALLAHDQLLTTERPDLKMVALSCAVLIGFAVLFFMAGLICFRRLRGNSNVSF